jgi:hypothetical protein
MVAPNYFDENKRILPELPCIAYSIRLVASIHYLKLD